MKLRISSLWDAAVGILAGVWLLWVLAGNHPTFGLSLPAFLAAAVAAPILTVTALGIAAKLLSIRTGKAAKREDHDGVTFAPRHMSEASQGVTSATLPVLADLTRVDAGIGQTIPIRTTNAAIKILVNRSDNLDLRITTRGRIDIDSRLSMTVENNSAPGAPQSSVRATTSQSTSPRMLVLVDSFDGDVTVTT